MSSGRLALGFEAARAAKGVAWLRWPAVVSAAAGLLAGLPDVLRPGGVALLEVGSDQAEAVTGVLRNMGASWTAHVHDDLTGRPRVLEVRRVSA